jgi:hypothetical protein
MMRDGVFFFLVLDLDLFLGSSRVGSKVGDH